MAVEKAEVDDVKEEVVTLEVADQSCHETKANVNGSLMSESDDEMEDVKSVKDDWKYRRGMWWLNYRRKIVYDKIRSKKSCKAVKNNLKVYENGIHEFVVEYKDVDGCDIRGWKKRLNITITITITIS